ncbi:hypothetical protein [Paenarthrobacter nitroguajacolicus]|uniref:hypothetical protein n=1 Tax=Paenarthrobacter nitroguajacolicus TaxID=211146 RepID=UPI00142EA0BA|nr:hypothetical protein [Paenarthrobacter nitroguajacolicus]
MESHFLAVMAVKFCQPFPAAREIRTTQLGTGVIADNPLSMASGQGGPEITAMT